MLSLLKISVSKTPTTKTNHKKGTQFLKTHGLKKNQVNNLMHIH